MVENNQKTEESLEGKINYKEDTVTLGEKLAKILRNKGYYLANCLGRKLEKWEIDYKEDTYGILKPTGNINTFLGIFKWKGRDSYIGKLKVDKEKWTVEVYGREYINELKELSNEFIKNFNVGIEVVLKKEKADLEHYLSDNSY